MEAQGLDTAELAPRIISASAGGMVLFDTDTIAIPHPFSSILSKCGLLRQTDEHTADSSWQIQELDVLYFLESIPFLHSFDLHFSGTHSNWSHLLPKELNALIVDLVLRCLHKQLMISEFFVGPFIDEQHDIRLSLNISECRPRRQ